MAYQYEEMDRAEMQKGIDRGYYPKDITLDEYHDLVNEAIDRMRGK